MNVHFNKSIIAVVICLGIAFNSFTQAAEYGGGSGTAEDPYQIWTPEQMNTIGLNPDDWGKHYKLMADIDMSGYTGTEYNIIGNYSKTFHGAFDGNGHVIRNLTIEQLHTDNIGVFGRNMGVIHHLGVENIYVVGANNTGGLVGSNLNGIWQCYVSGIVFGDTNVGGLVGSNLRGGIRDSYATGSILGHNCVGGLVGLWNDSIDVFYCNYSTCEVYGESFVGGLAGKAGFWTRHCYMLDPYRWIDFLFFENGNMYVLDSDGGEDVWFDGDYCEDVCDEYSCWENCAECFDEWFDLHQWHWKYHSFWDQQTSGQDESALGFGKSTQQMQDKNIYLTAGWDFVGETANGTEDVWVMSTNGGYPQLAWQPRLYDVRFAPGTFFNSITWLTNQYADSIVEYGSTPDLGSFAFGEAGTSHRVAIPSVPGDLYWRPRSTDQSGRTVYGGLWNNTIAPPTVVNISNVTATVCSPTTTVISWSTNVPTGGDEIVRLREDGSSVSSEIGVWLIDTMTRHSVTLHNLKTHTKYYYSVRSEGSDFTPEYSFTTGSLGITNIRAEPAVFNISNSLKYGARIYWKTDIPASSIVEYEPAGLDSQNSVSDGNLVTDHAIEIKYLRAGSTYRYRVKSVDAQSNIYYGDWKTFTTNADYVYTGGGGGCVPSNEILKTSYSNVQKLVNGAYRVKISVKNVSCQYYAVKMGSIYLGAVQAQYPRKPYSFSVSPGQTHTFTADFPVYFDNSSGSRKILYLRCWNSDWPYNNGFIHESRHNVILP